jgi:hypothetical protein
MTVLRPTLKCAGSYEAVKDVLLSQDDRAQLVPLLASVPDTFKVATASASSVVVSAAARAPLDMVKVQMQVRWVFPARACPCGGVCPRAALLFFVALSANRPIATSLPVVSFSSSSSGGRQRKRRRRAAECLE